MDNIKSDNELREFEITKYHFWRYFDRPSRHKLLIELGMMPSSKFLGISDVAESAVLNNIFYSGRLPLLQKRITELLSHLGTEI